MMPTEGKFRPFENIETAVTAVPGYPIAFWVLRNGAQTSVEVACCEESLRNAVLGTDFGKSKEDRIYVKLPVSDLVAA